MIISRGTGRLGFPAGFADSPVTRGQLKIIALTQSAYDALNPPDADAIYLIEEGA
jgi:hypothetical protein